MIALLVEGEGERAFDESTRIPCSARGLVAFIS